MKRELCKDIKDILSKFSSTGPSKKNSARPEVDTSQQKSSDVQDTNISPCVSGNERVGRDPFQAGQPSTSWAGSPPNSSNRTSRTSTGYIQQPFYNRMPSQTVCTSPVMPYPMVCPSLPGNGWPTQYTGTIKKEFGSRQEESYQENDFTLVMERIRELEAELANYRRPNQNQQDGNPKVTFAGERANEEIIKSSRRKGGNSERSHQRKHDAQSRTGRKFSQRKSCGSDDEFDFSHQDNRYIFRRLGAVEGDRRNPRSRYLEESGDESEADYYARERSRHSQRLDRPDHRCSTRHRPELERDCRSNSQSAWKAYRGNRSRLSEASSYISSSDEETYPRRRESRPGLSRRIHDSEIQNADRKMEKWHLTFDGDSRHRSLEDFLHKVRMLARMDRIPENLLLLRIHTILRREAYDWFLCYSDELRSWDDFEDRIRHMYGNPCKDEGNKQRIQERKQQRNETFLSYKMDLERLNKMLSKPLDQQSLFEIIWNNMRPHYRSRLALRTVTDIQKLAYYAHRIDANDPAFRGLREGGAKREGGSNLHNLETANNLDTADSDYSAYEMNYIGKQYDRSRSHQEKTGGKPEMTVNSKGIERPVLLCWNCRKQGHIWRQCREEKRIFCYICGNPGKTSTFCDNHPKSSKAQMGN